MHVSILELSYLVVFLAGAFGGASLMGLCLGRGVRDVLNKITEDFFDERVRNEIPQETRPRNLAQLIEQLIGGGNIALEYVPHPEPPVGTFPE